MAPPRRALHRSTAGLRTRTQAPGPEPAHAGLVDPTEKGPAVAVADRLTLRNLYLYLVCLVTLIVSLFAAVRLVQSVVELLYPDPGYYYAEPATVDGKDQGLSPAERERMQQLAEDQSRRQAVLGIVGSATTLAIAGPLYVYHWRRVQKELPER